MLPLDGSLAASLLWSSSCSPHSWIWREMMGGETLRSIILSYFLFSWSNPISIWIVITWTIARTPTVFCKTKKMNRSAIKFNWNWLFQVLHLVVWFPCIWNLWIFICHRVNDGCINRNVIQYPEVKKIQRQKKMTRYIKTIHHSRSCVTHLHSIIQQVFQTMQA